MSMHLAGPGLTTTSHKKRTTRLTKAQQAELQQGWRERNQRLKQMQMPKETFEQYMDWVHGRVKKSKPQSTERYTVPDTFGPARTDAAQAVGTRSAPAYVTGACSSPASPTYTGSAMIGIATMHKSNMVPVFSNQEATDISKMRR